MPDTQQTKASKAAYRTAEVIKTDPGRRLVFGFVLICKEDGVEYNDLQGEHVPEDVMLDAALDFSLNCGVAKAMHDGDEVGTYPFLFPLTTDIAKALGIESRKTGLLAAAQFEAETFKRFESGELKAFSIGGSGYVVEEEVA